MKDYHNDGMTTIASAQSTYLHVRKLDRGKYRALAAVVFLTLLGLLGLLLRVAQQHYPDLISNIMYPLTSFVGASWAFTTAYRAYHGPWRFGLRYALAWLLVGTGLLANSLAGLYYTYLERSGHTIL